jgi:hypothetical protein
VACLCRKPESQFFYQKKFSQTPYQNKEKQMDEMTKNIDGKKPRPWTIIFRGLSTYEKANEHRKLAEKEGKETRVVYRYRSRTFDVKAREKEGT